MTVTAASTPRIVPPDPMRVQIYDDLRQRLQGGEFGPEDRLVDTEIARQYGTSRMPVREALLALASQGFLHQTSRGFVIPKLSPTDVRDIFEVRKLLEPPAAAAAAAAIGAAGIARLGRALERAREAAQASDAQALMLANMEFRAAWIEALANRRLRDVIEGFSDHAQAVRIATLREPRIQRVVLAGITALHDAFVARDAGAARSRMASFMATAEREYFRLAGGK